MSTIKGHRTLTPEEISTINEIKEYEVMAMKILKDLGVTNPEMDKRSLAVARTHFETAFMWLVRAIAKPVPPEDL